MKLYKEIKYQYTKYNEQLELSCTERDPKRKLVILNPDKYSGQLSLLKST